MKGINDYKTLYYPAAGGDFKSVKIMLSAFPKIQNVIMLDADIIGYGGFDYWVKERPSSNYWIAHSGFNGSLESKVRSEFEVSSLSGENLDDNLTKYTFKAKHKGKPLDLNFVAGHLMLMKPEYIEGPAVHLIQCPGDCGYLSGQESFYAKIIGDMSVGDIMVLGYAVLPAVRKNEDILGVKRINLGIEKPRIVKRSFGHKLFGVEEGYVAYEKKQHIAPETLNDFWFAANMITPYYGRWKEPMVMRRCD
jgi:hypothetical protein